MASKSSVPASQTFTTVNASDNHEHVVIIVDDDSSVPAPAVPAPAVSDSDHDEDESVPVVSESAGYLRSKVAHVWEVVVQHTSSALSLLNPFGSAEVASGDEEGDDSEDSLTHSHGDDGENLQSTVLEHACSFCDMRFGDLSSSTLHIRMVHGSEFYPASDILDTATTATGTATTDSR